MDGEERGRPCREREDEEAYLHAWGWRGWREADRRWRGVTIDGGVEGGVHGGRRSRDGDAAVDDVVEAIGPLPPGGGATLLERPG